MSGIRFVHNGIDLKWQHITPKAYREENFAVKLNEMPLLEFDDIGEITSLISMLEYFKRECEDCRGVWRRKYEQI